MMRIAACLEYDGSRFFGWQKQAEEPTVQGMAEIAFGKIANHDVNLHCAGRTDTGVHACGQSVHFDTDQYRTSHSWVSGTNSELPEGVSVVWAQEVDPSFHARFSAVSRMYRYIILNRLVRPTYLARRVTWIYESLDAGRMNACVKYFLGKHDFNALRASKCSSKNPVKEIKAMKIHRAGDWIWIDVEADGFLHHMVRNIVGVLREVGNGERSPEWVADVIASRDRKQGGITAPADGLYFVKASYPEMFNLPPCPPACNYW